MFPYPEQYRLALPPLITAFMVLWSLLTRPLLGDASPFALYPLLLLFPLALGLHLHLIWQAAAYVAGSGLLCSGTRYSGFRGLDLLHHACGRSQLLLSFRINKKGRGLHRAPLAWKGRVICP